MQGKSTTLFHLNPPSFFRTQPLDPAAFSFVWERAKKCAPEGHGGSDGQIEDQADGEEGQDHEEHGANDLGAAPKSQPGAHISPGQAAQGRQGCLRPKPPRPPGRR